LLGIEAVENDEGTGSDEENESGEVQGVDRGEAAEVEEAEPQAVRPFEVEIESQQRSRQQEQAQRIRADLLRVSDVVWRQREERGASETDRPASAAREKGAEGENAASAPKRRRNPTDRVRGMNSLDDFEEDIIEGRVKSLPA